MPLADDGHLRVAFVSRAGNLFPGVDGTVGEVFVRDLPGKASALDQPISVAAAVNVCGSREIWVQDAAYGSPAGGFYWDPLSSQVWTPAKGWHYFAPNPPRPNPEPLWVSQLDYGSAGEGFYWDPVSGQVWTAEHGWHVHAAHGCGLPPGVGGLTLRPGPSRPVPPPADPVSSQGAEILSAEFVSARCEDAPCQGIQVEIRVAYAFDRPGDSEHIGIGFTPLLVYGRCLVTWVSLERPRMGMNTGILTTSLRFMGCPGETVVRDEIYALQLYIEPTDGSLPSRLAQIEVPFFADLEFVR
jgi:hypothetical protein